MTDRERWARINELMNAALEQPAATREAWLKEHCGDDTELFEEVLSLLAFDAEKTGGVRGSIEALAGELGTSAESLYIGERVGNYRITEKIAEGGMGIVFLGEHAAGDFEQTVAIKLLPQHRIDETANRRFVEERRILAGLEHPNIARLIDGGTLGNGVPFIVMEYVNGQTIDQWCRTQKLDNAAVIRLVMQVCDAVQYAHRKLVIHRDIKPANILVNRQGVPKLLDFGIANLLEPDAENPELTRAEQRALTPMYASPEQIEGLPITTAADVYGLGLLLYRLLTGQMPYAPTGPTPRELELAILSQTPEKPSTVVVSGNTTYGRRWQQQQQRALRGELDTILLTALRKDPDRRYSSVANLRDDLARHLEHRPILARGDSPLYVFGKFLRRHRWPVSFATAALVSGVLMTSYYTNRLQLERNTAQQTAAFFTELFEARNPYVRNADGLTVEALFEEGIRKIEDNTTLSPLVRARLMTTIAVALRNLGDIPKAERMAEEALALVEATKGRDAPEVLSPLDALIRVRADQANYEAAAAIGERMYALAMETKGELSEETARATHQLWLIAYRTGDMDAMARWAEKTYAIRKAFYDADDPAIAVGANALGLTHWRNDEMETAAELYSEVARIQNAQPERNDLQYASTLHNLGLLYNDTGRFEDAIASYRQVIEIHIEAGAEDGSTLPLTMYALSHSLEAYGDFAGAHRMFLETVPKQVAVAGPETHMVAYALAGQGMLLEGRDEHALARPILEEADRIYQAIFDEPNIDQVSIWVGLAYIAIDEGRFDDAEPLMQKAVAMRSDVLGEDHITTLRAQTAMARLEYARGDHDAAAARLTQSLERFARIDEAEHPYAVEAMTWLGRVRLAEGSSAEAVELLQRAVTLGAKATPPAHEDNVLRRLWLAEARLASGESVAADDVQRARGELAAIRSEWEAALAENPLPPLEELLHYDEA